MIHDDGDGGAAAGVARKVRVGAQVVVGREEGRREGGGEVARLEGGRRGESVGQR